jgi:hypothetical protein
MVKLTLAAAIAGAVDSASFAATRRDVLRAKPGRAAGTAVGLGLWLAMAQSAATGSRRRARRFAALALAANGAMLGAHVRAGVKNRRIYVGAGLAAAALAGTLRR